MPGEMSMTDISWNWNKNTNELRIVQTINIEGYSPFYNHVNIPRYIAVEMIKNLHDEIEFEVVGCQFKQQDDTIVVVGKLLNQIKPEVDMPLLKPTVKIEEPKPKSLVGTQSASDQKQVIFIPTAPVSKTGTRRKLRKPDDDNSTNELLTL